MRLLHWLTPVAARLPQFHELKIARMDVWEALSLLNELREYEAALTSGPGDLDPDMGLMEHALQTAELCRLQWPDRDHLHLAGLIHGLGKLLAHSRCGATPEGLGGWGGGGWPCVIICRPQGCALYVSIKVIR